MANSVSQTKPIKTQEKPINTQNKKKEKIATETHFQTEYIKGTYSETAEYSTTDSMARAMPAYSHEGDLAKDQKVNGVLFKAGTHLKEYPNGSLLALIKVDHKIQGIVLRANTYASFFDNGNIKICTLAKDTNINGLIFKSGTNILLYENGSPKIGTLAKDSIIAGKEYKAGQEVKF